MSRLVLTLSILFNAILLAILAYLMAYDPVVATISTPGGLIRTVLASVVNQELVDRHGEEVQSDLVGRALIDLAAEESNIDLDETELEARWQDWLNEPGTRARIDSGEVTEQELRDRLVTLVLLDQLSWNELTFKEQEALSKEFFTANQSEFEQLHLRHIVVESQKDARDVSDRLAAGVDFQELARRFSLDPLTREQGGDMGWKRRADLTEDLRAFLFLQPTGSASTPVSSPSGWHIFLVEDRRDSYQDCKDMVRRELTRMRRPETLDGLRNRFKVERTDGKELRAKLERPGFLRQDQERAFQQPATGVRPGTGGKVNPSASPASTPADLPEAAPTMPPDNQPLDPSGLPPVPTRPSSGASTVAPLPGNPASSPPARSGSRASLGPVRQPPIEPSGFSPSLAPGSREVRSQTGPATELPTSLPTP